MGAYSYALVSALADPTTNTFRALAEAIARIMGPRASPVFQSTDPDAAIFRTPRAPESVIEIIAPAATRGQSMLTTKGTRLALEGRVLPAEGLAKVWVRGEEATLLADGRFVAQRDLDPGIVKIDVIAFYAQRPAVRTELQVAVGADFQLALAGKRYALVIGNAAYRDRDNWSELFTPGDDARAIQAVLHERYGFETHLWAASFTAASTLRRRGSMLAPGRQRAVAAVQEAF